MRSKRCGRKDGRGGAKENVLGVLDQLGSFPRILLDLFLCFALQLDLFQHIPVREATRERASCGGSGGGGGREGGRGSGSGLSCESTVAFDDVVVGATIKVTCDLGPGYGEARDELCNHGNELFVLFRSPGLVGQGGVEAIDPSLADLDVCPVGEHGLDLYP